MLAETEVRHIDEACDEACGEACDEACDEAYDEAYDEACDEDELHSMHWRTRWQHSSIGYEMSQVTDAVAHY